MNRREHRAAALPLALLLLLAPAAVGAQSSDDAPAAPPPGPAYTGGAAPLGFVVTVDAGGGGMLGGRSQYARGSLFELELGAGYELGGGFRPEVSVLWGLAPRSHTGFRAGLHYDLLDTPFYARAALDWSNLNATSRWRWLLVGAGGELRITDLVGAFAEVDGGVPLARNVGLALLVRAGATFRF